MTNYRVRVTGFGRVALFVAPVALLVACGGSNDPSTSSGGGGSGGGAPTTIGTSGTAASAGTAADSGGAPTTIGTSGTAASAGTADVGGAPAVAGSGGAESGGTAGALGSMGGAESGGTAGALGGSAGALGSIGGSAGMGGGSGGSGTVLPPFSTPTTITTVSEEPTHGCGPDELGSLIFCPTHLTKDDVSYQVPSISACEPTTFGFTTQSWWSVVYAEPPSVNAPIKHTWVALLTIAVGGKYADTAAAELIESEHGFGSATCFSQTKGSATSTVYGADPEAEQVICAGFNTDLYGGLGTFKARLVQGAPSVSFYPKDGSAPVALKVVDL